MITAIVLDDIMAIVLGGSPYLCMDRTISSSMAMIVRCTHLAMEDETSMRNRIRFGFFWTEPKSGLLLLFLTTTTTIRGDVDNNKSQSVVTNGIDAV